MNAAALLLLMNSQRRINNEIHAEHNSQVEVHTPQQVIIPPPVPIGDVNIENQQKKDVLD